jgi:inhibitor of cysteine peptidase
MKKVKRKSLKKKKSFFRNRFGFTPVYLVALVLVSAVALAVMISKIDNSTSKHKLSFNPNNHQLVSDTDFKKFASAEEFKAYLKNLEDSSGYFGFGNIAQRAMPEATFDSAISANDLVFEKEAGFGGGGSPDRVSDTNVQVFGIDEPDIVKTNGQEIFFSESISRYWATTELREAFIDEDSVIQFDNKIQTKVINAWPPSDLAVSADIDLTGELLLAGDVLIVFSGQDIVAYDISNPEEPVEKWDIQLDDSTYLNTSRLYDGQIYLLTQTRINTYNPCPINPLILEGEAMIVPCLDIYYPISPGQINSTFTALSLDAQSGEITDKVSFVGDQNTSNVYMSEEALYVAYRKNIDMFDFMFDFITSEIKDLVPADMLVKLNKLSTYDISSNSKLTELSTIIEDWTRSLDKDAMLKMENEMSNRMETYHEKNKRYISTTGIVKIGIDDLDIEATGVVPGYLLNQFAMDEHKGYLRVATTIGESWGWGLSNRGNQANDVYILDSNLNIKGSILDLGLEERIYAARFIGDVGYLVTFRQVDPFYTLDLSNPKDPKMVGELKIPGYSSYLHPISKDRILGIGMEDRQVKISYFDVADPANPQEIAKYTLDEYGSEALHNHHAFLNDADNQVFFLPSYKGGYVFSYADDQIELVRALNVPNVKRALYLDNYLYILAEDYIAVLNEDDWEKVNDLDL